ncbi:adenosine deaminase [Streptomyces sp. NPDC048254]|uniref:adenosine deaminase n=1 Tax=Streptomyces sp. NPDC048254 TaxID=3365525 RepID=UPI00371B81F9
MAPNHRSADHRAGGQLRAVPPPKAAPRRSGEEPLSDRHTEPALRDVHAFIAGLPKAELHVHHVGSASPRIVSELAARHPDSRVPTDPEALADYFTFTDFAHFIEVYLSVVDLIRTPEDVRLLTYEVARELGRQQVRYAELTITPFSSTRRGIDARAFMDAIEDARKAAEAEFGTVLRWCFDIPGEAGLEAAEETVRLATDDRLRPEGLVSFGLGGPEIGVPRPQFKPYFDRAVAAGLHSVPHAGETTGPGTVWDALVELHAERIGHGTSSAQDPKLLAHLAEQRVALEVCPTSNIATRAVRTLEEHPIKDFVDAGVLVTVNSDDPPMFGTDLNNEYAVAARLLGLDERGVADLARNAVEASFLDQTGKARISAEIDAYTKAWLAP